MSILKKKKKSKAYLPTLFFLERNLKHNYFYWGLTSSFLASIHREASTAPAFSTLIHHTVGVTLLMIDSNVKDLGRFTLLHMNVGKPGTSSDPAPCLAHMQYVLVLTVSPCKLGGEYLIRSGLESWLG